MSLPSATRIRFLVAVLAVLCVSAMASAAEPVPAALWGDFGTYRRGFVDFWTGAFKKQNGVVMLALGVGAIGIFIITRGKWKK